jgi:YD repeat-containing protein
MTSPADRYAAFISYRHKPRDRQWALRIMAALETYRTPRPLQAEAFPARIGRLFRDEDEIPASRDLSDQIKDALLRSDNLIVICSPDTPGSRWVRREIELFHEMGKSERIFPLLIAGEPEESFPPELLRRRIWRDLPDGSRQEDWEEVEPIAADVRPRKDESPARTERRALLRLAAALLGCRFDDLARRDEERRKAERRRQLGAAAMLLVLAGLSGLWWWDANLRVKTQYCAAYIERWATPFCAGELSAAEQTPRATSFRFHIRGGRVLDMTRINGTGAPDDDGQTGEYEDEPWTTDVAEWRFAYRSGARSSEPLLASAALYDRTGKPLRQIGYEFSEDRRQGIARFDRNFGMAERQSAEGSALDMKKPTDRYGTSRRSTIGQHRLSFDAEGHLLRRDFEPVGGGASVADAIGSYGRTYEYNALGRPRVVRNLNALGEPLIEKSGIASVRRSYDSRGDLTSVEWLDSTGRLRGNGEWFAKLVLVRDANGNIEKYGFLNEAGAPAIRRDFGVASLIRKYDGHGNYIEETCFGIDGKRALQNSGFSLTRHRYDARGNEVERAYFDVDDKPVLEKGGLSRFTQGYDEQGNRVETAYFDVDGRPTRTGEGISRVTWHFDERGHQLDQAYFDTDGKPTANATDGIARIVWRYDERGNQVGRAFFGADGKPTLHKNRRVAGDTFRYDGNGNQVEEAYFGVDGKPTLSFEGVARVNMAYDEHGNVLATDFFDADGQPTLHKDGYARWTTRYDERGNSVERNSFGIDGKPVTNKDEGAARATYRYDERGNKTEVSFFGVDGKPTLSVQDIARWVSKYDERGNEVETNYFGVDGAPALNVGGSARVTRGFDERGNHAAEAYFGIDGKPTLDEGGTASSVFRYDGFGRRVEEAYFGVDGKPTLSKQGVARVIYRYDERGNQIEQAYFGIDGKPKLATTGVARWVARFDPRGNIVESVYFDADGQVFPVDGIGAKALYAYDDKDRRISVVYLDELDQPVPVEVEVDGIVRGSTAARIGLKIGDRVLSYGGEPLHSADQLIALVGNGGSDNRELTYRRNRTTLTVQVPPGRLGAGVFNVPAGAPKQH